MPDQRIPTPAEEDQKIDSGILDLLLRPCEARPISEDEIVREIGNEAATDGLARLYGAGLVHRLDGFAGPREPRSGPTSSRSSLRQASAPRWTLGVALTTPVR